MTRAPEPPVDVLEVAERREAAADFLARGSSILYVRQFATDEAFAAAVADSLYATLDLVVARQVADELAADMALEAARMAAEPPVAPNPQNSTPQPGEPL